MMRIEGNVGGLYIQYLDLYADLSHSHLKSGCVVVSELFVMKSL